MIRCRLLNRFNLVMKKIFYLILLIMPVTSVMAEWEGGYISYDGKMTLYFDAKSLQVSYPLFRMWSLMDFNESVYENVLSAKILTEYHCEQKTRRVIHIVSYSKNKAMGPVSSQSSASQAWRPLSHNINTSVYKIFKTVCGIEVE